MFLGALQSLWDRTLAHRGTGGQLVTHRIRGRGACKVPPSVSSGPGQESMRGIKNAGWIAWKIFSLLRGVPQPGCPSSNPKPRPAPPPKPQGTAALLPEGEVVNARRSDPDRSL